MEHVDWQSALQLTGKAFCVVNQGCKVNRVEADTVSSRLEQLGGRNVSECDAELIVINTCTVTGEAEKKARKAVRHALSASPQARVIVTGCAVAIDTQAYQELGEKVEVIQKFELLHQLEEALLSGRSSRSDCPAPAAVRVGRGFRTRVNVKVQDGCDRACTYCIVHIARGPARSTPYDQVLAEARQYLKRGVKELVLTGIDLGSYRSSGRKLADLISELIELADGCCGAGEPPARIRSSSLEPVSVDERFVDLMAVSQGRLCRHLHLPLQSGSSKVLREMGRPYTAEYFEQLVSGLYERVPELSLSTDVICGFPGESDEEFERSMELAKTCRFSKIHVFPYSMRSGTPAARRLDQVDEQVKSNRAARLRRLGAEMRARDLLSRKGKRELAIVEERFATTESYHEIAIPDGARTGDLIEVVL